MSSAAPDDSLDHGNREPGEPPAGRLPHDADGAETPTLLPPGPGPLYEAATPDPTPARQPLPPGNESAVAELRHRWRELRERGQNVSAEELCGDRPELLEALRHDLQAVEAMEAFLDPNNRQAVEQPADPDRTNYRAPLPSDDPNATRYAAGPADPYATAYTPTEGKGEDSADGRPPRVAGYEVLGVLGRGGMGVVYKARQIGLNRVVALKMILAGGHAGAQDRQRFRTEAEAVARLQHPNIIQIHEIGEADGHPFFSLEFCPGGSLAGKLDGTPLPAGEAARLVETLARAVQAAHEAGIVHRDLKPANVLLAADGTPKITDFGLAKKLDAAGQTASGAILGTPSYMAPEQAGGKTMEIGPAADVYALGAIFYELLTGRPPFKASTALDTLRQVLSEEPVPPSRFQSKLPRDLETICLKCLHKSPHRRYGSGAELAEELRRFEAGEPIVARPVGAVERGWRWCRRNRVVAGALGAVALALLLGTAVAWAFAFEAGWQRQQAEANAERAAGAKLVADERAEEARAAEWRARRYLYITKMQLAQSAWREARIGAGPFLDLLGEAEPGPGEEDLRGFEWHYLRGLCHRDLLTLRMWDNPVSGVTFSPDGSRLAGACLDRTVKVWDVRTGQELALLKPHAGPVRGGWPVKGLCFSPDGRRLASASDDKTVEVWDVQTGQTVVILKGHTDPVNSVCFSPDGRRLASASGTFIVPIGRADPPGPGEVKVWDAQTGQEQLTFKGHTGAVLSVAFSPDGRRLASAGKGFIVKVWDAQTGKEQLSLSEEVNWVTSVAFSPDGKRLASASALPTVKVWDAQTGQELLALQGHTERVNAVCFSPDGQRLASASQDQTVKVWDAHTGQAEHTLRGHTFGVWDVAFSPDSARLATSGGDRMIKIWDARRGDEPLTFAGAPDAAFSPDGKLIASCDFVTHWGKEKQSEESTLKVWDTQTGQEVLNLTEHREISSLCFSPDGKRLAGACKGKTVKVWDVRTGREVLAFKESLDGVKSICFGPDGRRLASGSENGTVKVWNAQTGQEQFTVREHLHSVHSVSFSASGERLASASKDGTLKVWDAQTGQILLTLKGPASETSTRCFVRSLCFSPDGKRLARAGCEDTDRGVVTVWDVQTGKEELTLRSQTGAMTSVCFSPDGRRLVTAAGRPMAPMARAGEVKVWDAETGQEVLVLQGHTVQVSYVTFSSDGARLLSADVDGTVRVWDAIQHSDRH